MNKSKLTKRKFAWFTSLRVYFRGLVFVVWWRDCPLIFKDCFFLNLAEELPVDCFNRFHSYLLHLFDSTILMIVVKINVLFFNIESQLFLCFYTVKLVLQLGRFHHMIKYCPLCQWISVLLNRFYG